MTTYFQSTSGKYSGNLSLTDTVRRSSNNYLYNNTSLLATYGTSENINRYSVPTASTPSANARTGGSFLHRPTNNGLSGWTAEKLNAWINKSIGNRSSLMKNFGPVVIRAAQASGLDPGYLVAHSAMETGWGTSRIVRQKYNWFGIGAFDASPGESAFTFNGPEDGFVKGAVWIAKNYAFGKEKQNTVWKMVHSPSGHNYATDPNWANNIANEWKYGEKNFGVITAWTPNEGSSTGTGTDPGGTSSGTGGSSEGGSNFLIYQGNTEIGKGFYSQLGDGYAIGSIDSAQVESVINGTDGAEYTDVYGNGSGNIKVLDTNPYASGGDDPSVPNTRILGLPLFYNEVCDPDGRVFNETIMRDLPLVFIQPGKPRLNKKLVDEVGGKVDGKTLLSLMEEAGDNVENFMSKFFIRNPFSGEDIRFINFSADYAEYTKYLTIMCSAVHAMMGLEGIFKWDSENQEGLMDKIFGHAGLCFYADKSTSISESANNEFGDSQVMQKSNDYSSLVREARTLLGDNFDQTLLSKVLDGVGDLAGAIPIIGNALGGLIKGGGRIVNGSNLLYPQVWQDSKFDRSYSISFKFFSPYGNKESIFQCVYLPFLALLTLALP